MGLPLYVAPVESDLRNKIPPSRHAASTARVHRMRRLSSDAVRESRRRAILTAAAASYTHPPDVTEEQRLQYRQRALDLQHHLYLEQRDPNSRVRQRLRERDHARMLLNRGSSFGIPDASRERLRRSLDGVQEHGEETTDYFFARVYEELNNPGSALASNTTSAGGRGTGAPPLMSGSAGTNPSGTLVSPPNNSNPAAVTSNDGNRNRNRNRNRSRTGATPHTESAESPLRVYHVEHADGPSRNEEPREPRHPTTDGFMDYAEDDPGADSTVSRIPFPRPRPAPSLRRVAVTSSSSRRPTVGWSDGNSERSGNQLRSSATSRIFGDISQIRNGAAVSAASAGSDWRPTMDTLTASPYDWAAPGWTAHNRESSPSRTLNNSMHLPPIRDLFDTAIDGLGDRQRSLSPEGDSVWDTLLTTLTPDPQPPSVGSSFASSSGVLAAVQPDAQATAEAQARVVPSSVRPRQRSSPAIVAPSAVPSSGVRREEAPGDGSTPVPLLVEALRTPNDAAAGNASGGRDSASVGGASSGTTSTNTSQRIRSPFTVVSAETDSFDESVARDAASQAEDEACRDSEMEEVMAAFDETDTDEMDDSSELDMDDPYLQEAFASLAASRRRARPPQNGNAARQLEHVFYTGNQDQPTRTGDGGAHATEETLDNLGIGGMQHIVRSLARREDIPDEWWAEAGLSRTLPHETSN